VLAPAHRVAGITGSFQYRAPRLFLLAGAGAIIAVVAAQLVDLPVA